MPTTYIGMGPDGPNSNLTEMERKARKMKREASSQDRHQLAVELSNAAIEANRQAMGIKGDYLTPTFQALIAKALK